ncbi:type I-B CRISPR-associated endonuclease Cas1b [Fodinibius sediminis]|uniref:CRISPR-associated endonuclease Cas1 n=1 Tax=Fodinibius sediminis TaxID=1214077 RepID=A0A521EN56_9BACT|nr:type I-B CRISPR-associated endonuclease Cas1b [Fodinibius sediminis]SMO85349.1 CRISPR-associated protein, Cas1 family [Fodinibius sediminis]
MLYFIRPYIFTSGKLIRKQNTIFFLPYEDEQELLEETGQTKEASTDWELITEAGKFKKEFNSENKRVIPIDDVDSLMVFSEINFNARMLRFLSKKNIPAHLFNYYGHYSGSYYPREYLLSGFLLVNQVDHYKQHKKRIRIALQLVKGAASNMLRNLKYYDGRAGDLSQWIERVEKILDKVPVAKDIQELMGMEGNIRQAYYQAFPTILGDKYDFNKRVKQPPNNAVNALISFGNSMVYTTCLTEIYRTQLSPLISYLHEPGARRYSLALDLAEIFKPLLADRVIFTCLNQRRIQASDFDESLNFCHLTQKGRKTFSKVFEEKLQTTIMHRELGRKVSYRRLIRMECYKLVKHLTGAQAYVPFKAWW